MNESLVTRRKPRRYSMQKGTIQDSDSSQLAAAAARGDNHAIGILADRYGELDHPAESVLRKVYGQLGGENHGVVEGDDYAQSTFGSMHGAEPRRHHTPGYYPTLRADKEGNQTGGAVGLYYFNTPAGHYWHMTIDDGHPGSRTARRSFLIPTTPEEVQGHADQLNDWGLSGVREDMKGATTASPREEHSQYLEDHRVAAGLPPAEPTPMSRLTRPRRYAAYRAPAGGIVARGTAYKGGEMIPNMEAGFMNPKPKRKPRRRKVTSDETDMGGGSGVAMSRGVRKYAKAPPSEEGVLNPEQLAIAEHAHQNNDLTGWGVLGDHLAENGYPVAGSILSKVGSKHPSSMYVAGGMNISRLPVGGFLSRMIRDGSDLIHHLVLKTEPGSEAHTFTHRIRPNEREQMSRRKRYGRAPADEVQGIAQGQGGSGGSYDPHNQSDMILADKLADHDDPLEMIVRRDLEYRGTGNYQHGFRRHRETGGFGPRNDEPHSVYPIEGGSLTVFPHVNGAHVNWTVNPRRVRTPHGVGSSHDAEYGAMVSPDELRHLLTEHGHAPQEPEVDQAASATHFRRLVAKRYGRPLHTEDWNNLRQQLVDNPQHRWGGPNADHTLRKVAADAYQESSGDEEGANLLRDPNQHVIFHKGRVVPGEFTSEHIEKANDTASHLIGVHSKRRVQPRFGYGTRLEANTENSMRDFDAKIHPFRNPEHPQHGQVRLIDYQGFGFYHPHEGGTGHLLPHVIHPEGEGTMTETDGTVDDTEGSLMGVPDRSTEGLHISTVPSKLADHLMDAWNGYPKRQKTEAGNHEVHQAIHNLRTAPYERIAKRKATPAPAPTTPETPPPVEPPSTPPVRKPPRPINLNDLLRPKGYTRPRRRAPLLPKK